MGPITMNQDKQSILQMSSTNIGHANKLNMCHKKRDEDRILKGHACADGKNEKLHYRRKGGTSSPMVIVEAQMLSFIIGCGSGGCTRGLPTNV